MIRLILGFAIAVSLLPAQQEPVKFPFPIRIVRIEAPNRLLLPYGGGYIEKISGLGFEVWEKGGTSAFCPATIQLGDPGVLVVTTEVALAGSKSYELRLTSENASITVSGKETRGTFLLDPVAVSTKGESKATTPYAADQAGWEFNIASSIRLKPATSVNLSILDYMGTPTSVGRVTVDIQDDGFGGSVAVVRLPEDKLLQPQVRLAISGLQNIFDENVTIPTTLVKLTAIPKEKKDSQYYLKALHQAGSGFPAWILDLKMAPLLGRSFGGGWRAKPMLDIDIGVRSVGSTKTNDIIKPAFAVTRFYSLSNKILEGLRVTPGIAYETNRLGTTGNLIGDFDTQLHFGRVYLPMENRRFRMWRDAKARAKADPKAIRDVAIEEIDARWGAGFQFFMGSEFGGATNERTVTAAKGVAGQPGTAIELPKFAVFRLRPKIRGFVEYRRLSWEVTFTPRYLFAREYYSIQTPDQKAVVLGDLKGFRPYTEAKFAFRLDRFGYASLSSTYKRGAAPPAYLNVNTFQTGIELRY